MDGAKIETVQALRVFYLEFSFLCGPEGARCVTKKHFSFVHVSWTLSMTFGMESQYVCLGTALGGLLWD